MANLPRKRRAGHARQQLHAGERRRPRLTVLPIGLPERSSPTSSDSELQAAVERARVLTGAHGAAIALGGSSGLCCRASSGTAPPLGTRLDPSSGLTGECYRTGETLLCSDTQVDPRVDPVACKGLEVRSVLVIPLRDGETVVGVFELLSATAAAFTERHIRELRQLSEPLIRREAVPVGMSAPQLAPATEIPPEVSPSKPFRREKHSPWSRTAIAGALILAGVFGYTRALRHSVPDKLATANPRSDGSLASGPGNPSTRGLEILSASHEQTAARVKGRTSGSEWSVLRASAEKGDSKAEYELAERYADGAGVRQDYAEAMRWFGKAAAQGNASAQWKLGLGYLHGIGVEQSDTNAAEWFKRAANQAHIGAQLALSELYFTGRGVPADYIRAYTWARIAAETTNRSQPELETIASRMTPEQLEEGERRVATWWHHRASPLAQ